MRLPQLLPKAPIARWQWRERAIQIVIDPVETGFPGAGMSREDAILNPGGETR
ncbi:MAG TPA: hypothetical protein VJS47_12730 [Rhizomicrobium sp.]|nr:hypothetical protein [Rhizomicrobium sp.]